MNWPQQLTFEFLDLYRNEQLLWDPKHPSCKDRHEIKQAWERIQSNFSIQCSVADFKRKKESLMTNFRLHIKRKTNRPNYKTTWFAYSRMESFLGPIYNVNRKDIDSEDEANHKHSSYITLKSTVKEEKLTSTPYDRKNTIKRQIRSQQPNNQSTDSMPYKDTHCCREWDECYLYGQLLAKKMQKLDEHQRDIAMHEIDNIMFRAKMKSQPTKLRYSSDSERKSSPVFITTEENPIEYEEVIGYEELDESDLD